MPCSTWHLCWWTWKLCITTCARRKSLFHNCANVVLMWKPCMTLGKSRMSLTHRVMLKTCTLKWHTMKLILVSGMLFSCGCHNWDTSACRLSVNKAGRRGFKPGYNSDTRTAASMRVQKIASILILYELKHAYFHVGCEKIMRQVMGVVMGSKGGPVLACLVCLHDEREKITLLTWCWQ